MGELIFAEEVYQIIGAAMECVLPTGSRLPGACVSRSVRNGIVSSSHPSPAAIELQVFYKGEKLASYYKADVLCFGEVITELKALERLTSIEESQIINYLKASRKHVGLLINFGSRGRLEWKRYVL